MMDGRDEATLKRIIPRSHEIVMLSPLKPRKRGYTVDSRLTVGCVSSTRRLPLNFPIKREVEPKEKRISEITTSASFSFLYFSNLDL